MSATTERLEHNAANGHVVGSEPAYLLHVPTTALFGLDALGVALLGACRKGAGRSVEELVELLAARFAPERIRSLAGELRRLEVLQPAGSLRPLNPRAAKLDAYPLSTLVLNVNTGCNLSCTYCYKEDLARPAEGRRMDFTTAARSVDLLFKAGRERERIHIVFFGGEPLSNVPLIRDVVAYAEARAEQAERRIEFSLTTNATLLNEELIGWLDAHRFGLSVSMDGPQAIHDRHRRSVGGKGTYAVVARKVGMLLARYRSRPVGARVTLGAGNVEVEAIHAHLRDELGFHEVGYAPVTSAADAGHALSEAELGEVHAAFERLGLAYRDAALAGRNNGFSNMHQLMTDLHEGRRKTVPCGAGIGMLAVDGAGELNLCHRFTGSELPTFGNVATGIDAERLGAFIGRASDREGTHCQSCRIRNLCAGGCYHESYARFGDPHHRTYHYCTLLRRWVDFGVGIYAEIHARNPEFFARHLEPRSAPA
ncbi:MAG TPA: quinohemoprotein amine dehydrogenase maturation protein [Steroidobacteraceae bacterium]|nr:quinohemoprotein amine dehydrogenase maturation protein [Steroidobacteraceae bacterium]